LAKLIDPQKWVDELYVPTLFCVISLCPIFNENKSWKNFLTKISLPKMPKYCRVEKNAVSPKFLPLFSSFVDNMGKCLVKDGQHFKSSQQCFAIFGQSGKIVH